MISASRTQIEPPEDMRLEDFFRQIYRPRRLLGGADITFRHHELTIRLFARFLGRPPMVSDLTEDILCPFLEDRAKGRSPRTANSSRDRLLALARFAVLKGRLPAAPDVAPLPEPKRIPRPYTVEEMFRLLKACAETTGTIANIPAGRYWFALAMLLYDTGARIGALWNLRLADVDRESRTILLRAEHAKQRADQLLRFAEDTAAAIDRIWFDRALLFPWPLSPSMQYFRWREIVRRAGLPDGRMDMFHRIRKTTASLCKRFGGDATAQLGHSTDSVTRKYYLGPDSFIQAADVLPRPFPSARTLPAPESRPLLLTAEVVPRDAQPHAGEPVEDDPAPPPPPVVIRSVLLPDTSSPPLLRIRTAIEQGASLVAQGFTMCRASVQLGHGNCYLRKIKDKYPDLWQLAIDKAYQKLRDEQSTKPHRTDPRDAVAKAANLVAWGLSMSKASARMGRHPAYVYELKRQYPEAWAASLAAAQSRLLTPEGQALENQSHPNCDQRKTAG